MIRWIPFIFLVFAPLSLTSLAHELPVSSQKDFQNCKELIDEVSKIHSDILSHNQAILKFEEELVTLGDRLTKRFNEALENKKLLRETQRLMIPPFEITRDGSAYRESKRQTAKKIKSFLDDEMGQHLEKDTDWTLHQRDESEYWVRKYLGNDVRLVTSTTDRGAVIELLSVDGSKEIAIRFAMTGGPKGLLHFRVEGNRGNLKYDDVLEAKAKEAGESMGLAPSQIHTFCTTSDFVRLRAQVLKSLRVADRDQKYYSDRFNHQIGTFILPVGIAK